MGRLVVISNRVADPRKPAAGGLAVALGESLQQTGGDVTLVLSANDSMTFQNTSVAQFTAADFVITDLKDRAPVVTGIARAPRRRGA